ncbi:MAG: hypothetical protein ACYTBR_16085 [Planctomycetota bacterium]
MSKEPDRSVQFSWKSQLKKTSGNIHGSSSTWLIAVIPMPMLKSSLCRHRTPAWAPAMTALE